MAGLTRIGSERSTSASEDTPSAANTSNEARNRTYFYVFILLNDLRLLLNCFCALLGVCRLLHAVLLTSFRVISDYLEIVGSLWIGALRVGLDPKYLHPCGGRGPGGRQTQLRQLVFKPFSSF